MLRLFPVSHLTPVRSLPANASPTSPWRLRSPRRCPTYSGGLGMLAGDTLRSAADTAAPMVAISLAHRRGYFRQHLDANGQQTETDVPWSPEAPCPAAGKDHHDILMNGRNVKIRAWRFDVVGVTGHIIPVFPARHRHRRQRPLGSHAHRSSLWRRHLLPPLSGDGPRPRRHPPPPRAGLPDPKSMPHERGPRRPALDRPPGRSPPTAGPLSRPPPKPTSISSSSSASSPPTHPYPPATISSASTRCTRSSATIAPPASSVPEPFTTALPQHDLPRPALLALRQRRCHAARQGLAAHVPGSTTVHAITNGVHAATWLSQPFQQLLDTRDPQLAAPTTSTSARSTASTPCSRSRPPIAIGKTALMDSVKQRTGQQFDADVLTLGFARRVATYKRASLLFTDPGRLTAIAEKIGGLQILFAGKAHPADQGGQRRLSATSSPQPRTSTPPPCKIVYLENYDWGLGAAAHPGCRRLGQHPAAPLRGLRNLRHEGRAQRRSLALHPRRLVD